MSKEHQIELTPTKIWAGLLGLMSIALLTNGLQSAPALYQGTPEPYDPGEPYLSQTATALAGTPEGQLRTQFKPEKGFSREMFETMRRGTFIVRYSGFVKGEGDGQIGTAYGTGWLAKDGLENKYFVTNRHVIMSPDMEIDFKAVYMLRPGIDRQWIRAWVEGKSVSANYDVGVLRLRFDVNKKYTKPLEFFEFEDNADMDKARALGVGFPADFHGSNPLRSSVWGNVVNIEEDNDGFFAVGISGKGASGTPVAKIVNGKIVVIGMIYAGTEDYKTREVHMLIDPLDVGDHIERLTD